MKDLSKDAVNRLAVGEDGDGQRIDNFLQKSLKGVPKSHIYRILRSGEVRRQQQAGRARRAAGAGRRAAHPADPDGGARRGAGTAARPARSRVPPVLYEDDALIALDKPSGLAVHGGSGIAFGVIERLRRARPEAKFLELVHRLDRDTSGVLLVAKKRAGAHRAARAAARRARSTSAISCWCAASGATRSAAVELALETLRRPAKASGACASSASGRAARTVFRRVQTWPDRDPPLALLEAELETGRTHQIRVHLTHLGFPLAGDDKYGDFAWNKALREAGAEADVPARAPAPLRASGRRPRDRRSSRRCRPTSRVRRAARRRDGAPMPMP